MRYLKYDKIMMKIHSQSRYIREDKNDYSISMHV